VRHPFVAAYEDMTVAQAIQSPETDVRWLTNRQKITRLKVQRRAYKRLQLLLFATSWPAQSASDDYGVPSSRIHTVGIGRNHSPSPSAKDWKTPRYLFIGKAWERKGGPELLAAFSQVKKSHPEAQLRLIGEHPGISAEGIFTHGFVPLTQEDRAAIMQDAWDWSTCLVVPSRCEAAGIVFAEACAAGVPSICGSVGGATSIVADAGITVTSGDVAELVTAMLHLADPQRAELLGRRALARSPEFEWPTVCERILSLFSAELILSSVKTGHQPVSPSS
jgi:glycosyltransferase involved in cell wall biosynthesis